MSEGRHNGCAHLQKVLKSSTLAVMSLSMLPSNEPQSPSVRPTSLGEPRMYTLRYLPFMTSVVSTVT